MHNRPPSSSLAGSLVLALLSGCGGGGGGGGGTSTSAIQESEPNGTSAEADSLKVGETGRGLVADVTDSDFWSVSLAAGQWISVEVFGNRLDQSVWTLGPNAAKVTLLGPDGATVLLEQGDEQFSWNSEQDTDISLFRAPAAGTYYLRLDVDDPLLTGGEYLLAVRNESLPGPLQFEQELAGVSGANDSDVTAEPIVPGTIAGFFVDDESDWYSFMVAEPSFVTFTMHAHRNGVWQGDDSYYDPELHLLDSALTSLAANDDTYYLDSAIHYVLMTPGTYFVQVGECCVSGDSGYYLEFTSEPLAGFDVVDEIEPNDSAATAQPIPFGDPLDGDTAPGDHDYYGFACNAGDRLLVEVFDFDNLQDALGDVDVTLEDALGTPLPDDSTGGLQIRRTILTATGSFFVHVTSIATTEYALRVTHVPGQFESEPDDAIANAGSFDPSGHAAGVIDVAADSDLFAFQGSQGVPVILRCLADNGVGPGGYFALNGFGSSLAPGLAVQDALGTVLASTDSTLGTAVGVVDGLSSVSLAFVPPATGTYYVQVIDQNGNAGANFTYVLEKR